MKFSASLTCTLYLASFALAGPHRKRSFGKIQLQARQNNNNQQNNGNNALLLQQNLVQTASQVDGSQQDGASAGQAASATDAANFINFCANKGTLTNGQQVKTGSCNGIPMGMIIAQDKLPAAKFQSPKNLDTIPANQDTTITLKVNNLQLGSFTNPTSTYYAAPAQVNGQGILIGHTHVTVQKIASLTDTNVPDGANFQFFKGVDNAADGNGNVQVTIPGGLPEGTYTVSTINSASNHQAFLASIAQRGADNDRIYITVSNQGNGGQNQGNNQGGQASNPGNGQANGNQGNGDQGNGDQGNGDQGNGDQENDGQNLQKFTGALGGVGAPAVTAGGSKGFLTDNNEFTNLSSAIQRSCSVQHNGCANAANASGNQGQLTVAACDAQESQCNSQ